MLTRTVSHFFWDVKGQRGALSGRLWGRGGLLALNRGYAYEERIGPRGAGQSLVDYLSGRYRHTPPEEWRERIGSKRVLVDDQPGEADRPLTLGQTVVWLRPPWEEPEVPRHYELLHEDASCLAVAKPSGLPTLPGAGFLEHTLLYLVRQRFPEASPAHRLGRGTSGLVLFTRTPEAGRVVSKAWREHRVEKVYRALVEGEIPPDPFGVEAPIGPLAHPRLGFVHGANPEGKPSHSEVRLLERRGGQSLVEVTIRTGRPHQIRIHMATCGHPLVGDPLYAPGGGFKDTGTALPGDTGYHLHALYLTLPHPATGEPLQVFCAPPDLLRCR